MQQQLELQKLKLQQQLDDNQRVNASRSNQAFDVAKHIHLVPPFQEKDVEQYFLHFEKIANSLKWPKEHWTMLLQSVLIRKARPVYTQLSIDQSANYEIVKKLILQSYE